MAPTEPGRILEALEKWKAVVDFRNQIATGQFAVVTRSFRDDEDFRRLLIDDFLAWLTLEERPWNQGKSLSDTNTLSNSIASPEYYRSIINDYQWLDIAGIDNDRTFSIPLSEMYVKLKVILDEDSLASQSTLQADSHSFEIQDALKTFEKLVIVGDPGSGKSTFLKYIALTISQATVNADPALCLEKLGLGLPLPIPIFLSCWDLHDFLRTQSTANSESVLQFIRARMDVLGAHSDLEALKNALKLGSCCVMFDGLDEVPTEHGRSAISRLIEEFVSDYSGNRFVITSRIRAYTGDSILRGSFTRCDIQEFDESARSEFLKNWFSLLFKVDHSEVDRVGSDSNTALQALVDSIHGVDRIRDLAVNPLLLTVIAIVHWNRKRLPEQRVELYDECVDVLLGQRKEAEHATVRRRSQIEPAASEESKVYDRNWTRKRFSEIALQILRGGDEEITKARVIETLRSRFIDRGAASLEEAEAQAELFLDRQELRSGLLVSRRSHSYRFVHLAFQEYLASWNLATQDPSDVKDIIVPHLREAKWFETLQLLGGEWAKRSDDYLDLYVALLLDNAGNSIRRQAPIMALIANVLGDTSGVAEIRQLTRRRFNQALTHTLEAFRPRSGVPAKTQVEILSALGDLGNSVKDHLIAATRSDYFQVRSLAVSLLAPHLNEADLFGMTHVLGDRSQETVRTYLRACISRDPARTVDLLLQRKKRTEKLANAVAHAFGELLPFLKEDEALSLARSYGSLVWYADSKQQFIVGLLVRFGATPNVAGFIRELFSSTKDWSKLAAVRSLINWRGDASQFKDAVKEAAMSGGYSGLQRDSIELLFSRFVKGAEANNLCDELLASVDSKYLRECVIWAWLRCIFTEQGFFKCMSDFIARWPDDSDCVFKALQSTHMPGTSIDMLRFASYFVMHGDNRARNAALEVVAQRLAPPHRVVLHDADRKVISSEVFLGEIRPAHLEHSEIVLKKSAVEVAAYWTQLVDAVKVWSEQARANLL